MIPKDLESVVKFARMSDINDFPRLEQQNGFQEKFNSVPVLQANFMFKNLSKTSMVTFGYTHG